MTDGLHKIAYLTLRTLLRAELYEVTYPQVDVAVKKVLPNTTQDHVDFSKATTLLMLTSLKQVKDGRFRAVYESSIALQLSSVLRRNALDIAYQILDEFHSRNVNFCQGNMITADKILSDFTGKVFSNGLLQFELGDRGLSIWLQCLMKPLSRSHPDKPVPVSIDLLEDKRGLFVCQHSHARCCSLLRHAHGSTITLNRLDNALNDPWVILDPDPIPWLAADGEISLIHPVEQRLMSQIVTIADDFSDLMTNSRSCLASAISLSQSFQDFYQACQIFGAPSEPSLKLSQGRLGLVMITQRFLNQLIEGGLNEDAPSEL